MKNNSLSDFGNTIINALDSGICVLDNHHQIQFLNDQFKSLAGIEDQMIHFETLIDSFDWSTSQKIKQLLAYDQLNFSEPISIQIRSRTTQWKVKNLLQNLQVVGKIILVESVKKQELLDEGQGAYFSLFEDSPIPIWDEDFSWIKQRIDALKAKGVTDIREFIRQNPAEMHAFIRSIVVNAINHAVVEINEAESKQQVLENYEELTTEKSAEYIILQIEAIFEGKTSCEFDAELLTFKGNKRYVHFKWSVVKGFETTYSRVYLTTTDLTERLKEDNLSLQQSNREKETLLKEIHHRVKNNLQIISSLIRLQANVIEDRSIKDILHVTLARIGSMASVHELLYKSSAYSKINYNEYLDTLVNSLLSSFINDQSIAVDISVDELEITLDTAIPLGLLINEILTNSLKHGFNGQNKGMIYIHFHKNTQGQFQLNIGDDGNGIGKEIHFKNRDTLGLSLIENLADQLSGSIQHIENGKGTHYELKF